MFSRPKPRKECLAAVLWLFMTSVLAASQVPAGRGLEFSGEVGPSGSHNYWALIVGIDAYQQWPRLQTAVHDAVELKEVLEQDYGFPSQQVVLRTNEEATLSRLMLDLRQMAERMGPDDYWLIYFAGHGQIDSLTAEGYWIPVEGSLKDPSTWLPHSTVKLILGSDKVRARGICVIADSCYAGTLLRGGPSPLDLEDSAYLEKLRRLSKKRSRQVITSGGLEPVVDGGRDGHSLFAYYFLKALRENTRLLIDLENLFHNHVWKSVAEIGGQTPGLGRLKTPMDEDGQFVLVRVREESSQGTETVQSLPPEPKGREALPRGAASHEEQAYEALRESEEIQQWEEFLRRFPEGLYAEIARQKIENLRLRTALQEQRLARERERLTREREELDLQTFQAARQLDTPEAYQDYLQQFPSGAFAQEARSRLRALSPAGSPRAEAPGPQEGSQRQTVPSLRKTETAPSPEVNEAVEFPEADAWTRVVQEGEPTRKVQLAEEFLHLFPESETAPLAHYTVALAAYQENDYPRFVTHAEKVLAARPATLGILVPLALAHAERGAPDRALEYAGRGLTLMRSLQKPAQVSEQEWQRTLHQLESDLRYAQGRANLDKYFALPEPQRAAWLEQAVDHLEAALELNPWHDYASFRLGLACELQGRIPQALRFYARTVAIQGAAAPEGQIRLEELHRSATGVPEPRRLIETEKAYLQDRSRTQQALPSPPTLRRRDEP